MSKLAIFAFVLGCTGVLFACTRAIGFKALAIPLGPMALGSGVLALWGIRRKGGAVQGTGLAVWGGILGISGTVLSVAMFAGMFGQQVDLDRMRQQQSAQLQRVVGRRPETKAPATNFTSNLPIVVLQGNGNIHEKHSEALMYAQFFDVDASNGRASVLEKPAHEGMVSMHARGTSSLQLPKHSFTFHTLDAETNQVKVSLLGMPKEDDWILYAPFEDKTMIRDVLAYQLSNEMGQYAPRTRYVELFIQRSKGGLSMRDYEGVYVLVEKIKRGKERVNVDKLTPENNSEPEISGGYIVKRDHGDGGGRRFRTQGGGGPYFFVYPSERAITPAQKSWLTKYFNQFERALEGPEFADPKRGYAAYLDVDAFIDLHWLIEMSKNVDGFRYSSYLTKPRNGKIKAGPAWDWNRSFGNANYYGGWQPQGWYWQNIRPNEISWYERLRQDPAFERRCNARWRELRRSVLDTKKVHATIDRLALELEESQQRNFRRWPILGQQVTCNHFVGDSYQEEVRWLKKWIERRMAWIDDQVSKGRETALIE